MSQPIRTLSLIVLAGLILGVPGCMMYDDYLLEPVYVGVPPPPPPMPPAVPGEPEVMPPPPPGQAIMGQPSPPPGIVVVEQPYPPPQQVVIVEEYVVPPPVVVNEYYAVSADGWWGSSGRHDRRDCVPPRHETVAGRRSHPFVAFGSGRPPLVPRSENRTPTAPIRPIRSGQPAAGFASDPSRGQHRQPTSAAPQAGQSPAPRPIFATQPTVPGNNQWRSALTPATPAPRAPAPKLPLFSNRPATVAAPTPVTPRPAPLTVPRQPAPRTSQQPAQATRPQGFLWGSAAPKATSVPERPSAPTRVFVPARPASASPAPATRVTVPSPQPAAPRFTRELNSTSTERKPAPTARAAVTQRTAPRPSTTRERQEEQAKTKPSPKFRR